MSDVIADLGGVYLGSRLKRLAERLQGDAARIIEDAGIGAQPGHMPLLTALDREAMTVGQLAEAVGYSQPGVTRAIGQLTELGLVEANPGADLRQRLLSLTQQGEATMARVRMHVWPGVGRAVDEMCGGRTADLLDHIARIETALSESSMVERHARLGQPMLTIREYSDDLAGAFHDINAEWIETMFSLEPTDREVLENPRERIVDPGGTILFVEAEGLGVVGTCALQKTGETSFELTKMGVRAAARGLKAGEFLLQATIERARKMGADPLYLLTNKRCEAAIHLYEKLGFRHDAGIMARYGARYARCDVAMLHPA
ncbi:MarR family transcriptional regulator with acetyltransferase activity [Novosphingobium sp. PhB165]|uniref:bifunctional helix-turn-helix transcriptional regulator/GNAT family N-acetyltransferase n=1 Tax=Novosphingobium sp. PhB165 TaxID=2485105 RepID=UPI00104C1DC7|nr:bifunctional helix-turn-helix transcriptional regulator/GNAT family N-acetyltransferase [Novosphingobium sp. PhB165]TCM18800.1 MarR family transcriptional regulator with acetyltransferase activity [Novosphingobium sp. PhB165]